MKYKIIHFGFIKIHQSAKDSAFHKLNILGILKGRVIDKHFNFGLKARRGREYFLN